MQALILAGGEGTRLRPLTTTVPKPVVPLVARPFIRFMIDWLHGHGVDDVVMSCGHLASGVRNVLGDGSALGIKLRYLEEPRPLGTRGAPPDPRTAPRRRRAAGGVRNVLGGGSALGIKLRYAEEPRPLGTGGALKYAEPLLGERFLMLNGDVLTDIDLTAQIEQHQLTGARATLALTPVEDPTAYGLVRVDDDT